MSQPTRWRQNSKGRGRNCHFCGKAGHYARECRYNLGLCIACGDKGHYIRDCPKRRDKPDNKYEQADGKKWTPNTKENRRDYVKEGAKPKTSFWQNGPAPFDNRNVNKFSKFTVPKKANAKEEFRNNSEQNLANPQRPMNQFAPEYIPNESHDTYLNW